MANLKSGNYSASAKSMKNQLKVDMQVKNGKITDLNVDLGGAKGFEKVAKKLANEVIEKQGDEIDAVTGASATSRAVKVATRKALKQADPSITDDLSLKNGEFIGTGRGHGGEIAIKVTTDNNKIKDVKVIKQSESPSVGDYAMKKIPAEIVKQQTLDVDTITGATVTSEAIITAANRAIAQAGDEVSWNLKPFTKTPAPAKDITADIAIAGGGLSGLALAAFAVKRGLKPVVIEKNDQVGGSFRYAAGAFAISGSKKLQAKKMDNDLEELLQWVKDLSKDSDKKPDMDFVEYISSQSGKTFDELLEIAKAKPQFDLRMPYHAAGFAPGGKISDIYYDFILANGGKVITSTKVTDILTSNGKITGLKAENESGSFTVTAPNVVITTGGASYNKKALLEKNEPKLKNIHLFNEANLGNTGDGYDFLKRLGAKFYGDDVYKNAELDFAPIFHITYANEPDYSKAFAINSEGKRFTNETPFSFLNLTNALYHEGSSKYWLIYDGKDIDPEFKKKLDAAKQDPFTIEKSSSIKELAEKICVNPTNFQDTFNDYQRACDEGNDKFGRPQNQMSKFDGKQGYYAVYVMPGSWGTMGGVEINREFQVKKEDGTYFDNLYAIGEMSTSRLFSEHYMIGFSLADYITEARLLADKLSN